MPSFWDVPQCSVFRPLLFTLYARPLSLLIHSNKLNYHLYADDSQVYLSLSTADTDFSLKQLSDISGWMRNNKRRLNANKTDFIIIGTSRQRSNPTHFFPTNILSHSITPSDAELNLGLTFGGDFNFRKHVSIIFVTVAVFGAMFLFQSPKPLLQHSLLVGLPTATLFFVT